MSTRIALIGAGSVVFAKNLIGDVLQSKELADATIVLMDIDAERLKVADYMAKKMVAKLGVKARIESTLDQKKAITGSNFVICTIQVGGYKPGTVLDFEIPRKFGLRQTIADTLGVGGVFRALRTIPVINKIAEDIADVGAPGCLLLNYTNPMAMNCWAVDRAVGIPHVGLCHSVQGTSAQLASYTGLPIEDISYLVAGVNHMAFFLKFEYRGKDAYPLLFKLLEDPSFHHDKVRFEMMRRTGYFVTESSEHQAEYVPYFIHHGADCCQRFDVPIDEYLRRCEAIMSSWKSTEADLIGKGKEIEIGAPTHEYGSYIIHSSVTGQPRVIYGNVPNHGFITNLPHGSCVEVPCLVDKNGIQPTSVGALPPQLAALCQTNINVQALTVEAALTKKREHIYHAVMLDPNAAASLTLDKIWAMCDELLDAHQKVGLLGDFEPVRANTGRSNSSLSNRVLAELKAPADLKTKVGDTNTFELVVENLCSTKQNVAFSVTSADGALTIAKQGKLKASVAPGKITKVPFTVTVAQPLDRKRELTLASEGAVESLCRSLTLQPRKKLTTSDKAPAPLEVKIAGNLALAGTLAIKNGHAIISCRVHDSDPKNSTPRTAPWDQSCVELFFDAPVGGQIVQIFIVPQKGKPSPLVMTRLMEDIPGSTASNTFTAAFYDLKISIPLSRLRLPEHPQAILFDIATTVSALGDAHSGGRGSLNNNPDSYMSSSHYAEVMIG
jgi:alpha-galactosidase